LLLNNLQPVMGNTPLLLFYPGRYDGQSLRLFGKLKNNNYYRAFKRILLPMASIKDIPTIPGELFAKFQTGFYAMLATQCSRR
jgi:Domain of unknown function (DUF1788)